MLYAVMIKDVFPKQCVVVWDSEKNATLLAEHLNSVVSDNAFVEPVTSFFPNDTCNADASWIEATNAYLQGYHQNTSGNNE